MSADEVFDLLPRLPDDEEDVEMEEELDDLIDELDYDDENNN